uniref:Ig-like domain-containing protein n=1 Tax=Leptobrachium leishanense TaxID=445787 RepID=A0A8C5MS41_9ANUR
MAGSYCRRLPLCMKEDSPTLRCQQWKGYKAKSTKFYKGDTVIRWKDPDAELRLTRVDKSASGTYKCSQVLDRNSLVYETTFEDKANITVKELFPDPEIKVSLYPVRVGAAMTLTCDTHLAPPRAQTELRFAFYRNGQKVQDFGRSGKYRVKSSEPYHSGDYTCDARTSSESVKKTSRSTNIRIEGAASRPVVSISPDWGKVFTGESITLTCNTDATDQTDQRYYWFKDRLFIRGYGKTFTITYADTRDTGEYRCQTHRGGLSDPIKVDVRTEAVILQTPPAVYEGDVLHIRCHYRKGDSKHVEFYKDNKFIKESSADVEFELGPVTRSASGSYKCKYGQNEEASTHITVEELFSDPEIKVSPYPVTVGTAVTLTCDTRLAPPRAHTKLQYAFYRNRQRLNNMDGSNTYNVQYNSADYYTCQANTLSGSVMKTSRELNFKFGGVEVKLEISASPNTGKIFRGESITLTCNLDSTNNYNSLYYWYKGNEYLNVNGKTIVIQSAGKNDGGDYHCNTSTNDRSDPFMLDVNDGAAVRPGISAAPNTGKIFTGDSVTLTCNVDSLDEGSQAYYWYKGRDYIYYSGKSFTIHSAERDDSGDYQCCTDSGDTSDPFTLDVSDDVSVARVRVGLKPSGGLVRERERLDVTCSVDRGSGTLEFNWCRQDAGTCEKKQLTDSQEARFVVESVVEGYSGEYYCSVTVSKPQAQIRSETVKISVIVPVSEVTISANIDDPEMVAGNNVTFTCSVKQGSSPSFLWLHNEKEVNSQSGLYQIRESGKMLYIESISTHHEGTYQCRASNQVSPDRTITLSRILTISVFVPVSDVRIRADKEDLKMVAGANVTFTCSVERGTSPSFLWLHKGEKVAIEAGLYQIRESGKTLYIESISPDHEGTYKCQASNQVSPSESFTAESNVLTISLSGKTSDFLSLTIALIFLVVLLIITTLVFTYRRKLSFIFTKCHEPVPRQDVFFAKGRVRAAPRPQNETNHSHQEPLESRNLPAKNVNEGDDVCYSYIDIRCRPQDSSPPRAVSILDIYVKRSADIWSVSPRTTFRTLEQSPLKLEECFDLIIHFCSRISLFK